MKNPAKSNEKIHFLYFLAVAAKQGKPQDDKADDSGKEEEPPVGKQMRHIYLAHVIEQPNFRIANPKNLQQNFVYLILLDQK